MPVFTEAENPAMSLFNIWSQFCGVGMDLNSKDRFEWPPYTEKKYPVARIRTYGIDYDVSDSRMAWGEYGWMVTKILSPDPAVTGFAYGPTYGRRWTRYLAANFILLSDGRFSTRFIKGWSSRLGLSKGTFLSIQTAASRERWTVRTKFNWHGECADVVDQYPHMKRQIMEKEGFGILWELVPEREGVWRIAMAANQSTPWDGDELRCVARQESLYLRADEIKREDRCQARRVKRFLEEYVPPRAPKAVITVDQIMASLVLSEPSKNVPHIRTRLLEATYE